MQSDYPKEWIKEPFNPKNIIKSQSDNMQHWFFDRPETIDEWIKTTQAHQAFSARMMTEAFRRDRRMISNAIHLFIDAWPSGWMKTIMDCKRNPKPAYFAYRNAIKPVIVSLRSDRFTYFSGEEAKIEAYICNDLPTPVKDAKIVFELYDGNKLIMSSDSDASCADCSAEYCTSANFIVPAVVDRSKFILKAILIGSNDDVIDYNTWEFEAFADTEIKKNDNVVFITDLTVGEHIVAGEKVCVKACDTRNYVNARTGHKSVKEFLPNDFRFWYNKDDDMLSVMTDKTFIAEGFTPIICAWDIFNDVWQDACVLAEKKKNGKTYIISTMDIRCENPVAKRLMRNLYKLGEK